MNLHTVICICHVVLAYLTSGLMSSFSKFTTGDVTVWKTSIVVEFRSPSLIDLALCLLLSLMAYFQIYYHQLMYMVHRILVTSLGFKVNLLTKGDIINLFSKAPLDIIHFAYEDVGMFGDV